MDHILLISIHALREEGDCRTASPELQSRLISIHALREEGDYWLRFSRVLVVKFLSTPSARRATKRQPHDWRTDPVFLSTPSARRATLSAHCLTRTILFLSTPSARRATSSTMQTVYRPRYFYPRPPRGGRPFTPHSAVQLVNDFYPRPPRGGRRAVQEAHRETSPISIHALREEGDLGCVEIGNQRMEISIHALREEGDKSDRSWARHPRNFYPRPPRGGRRFTLRPSRYTMKFLSTPSARRATKVLVKVPGSKVFLSTPSARRATRPGSYQPIPLIFLSTPSARRATPNTRRTPRIHSHFYPRPPRGGRPGRPAIFST